MPLEISWRGQRQHSHFHQLAGDQRGRLRNAKTDGQVKAIRHQVPELIPRVQVQLQLRVLAHEFTQHRPQHQPRKVRVDVHPQPPANRQGAVGRRAGGFFQAGQQGGDFLVETPALVGQLHRAGSAVEQADAQAFFQPRNSPADPRRRHLQAVGGAGETAAVDHGGQYAHATGQSWIKTHG